MWMGRKHRISDSKYHLLVEQASDGIVITDADGHYLEVNSKMCQITGYTREELLDKRAQDIIHPDDLDRNPIQWEEAKAGKTLRADRRLIRKSGETVYTEISACRLEDGTFMGILRDVTERKLSEALRRESEEKYRLLFEYANDAIFIVDIENSQIIDANRHAAKQLGYTREELLDMKLKDVEVPISSGEMRVIKNQLSSTGMLIFEQEYRRKEGPPVPMELSSRIIEFEGRKVLLNFARDITQRRMAEETERDLRILAEAMRDTAAELSSTLDVNEVVNRVLENVVRVVPCDTANIMLIEDDNTVRVVAQRGYDQFGVQDAFWEFRLSVEQTPKLSRMVETGQAHIVSDTTSDNNWIQMSWTEWIRSTVGAPIKAEGKVIGFIHLDSVTPRAFNPIHAERLQAFANQASTAIQNARRYQGWQNYASELETQVAQRTAELMDANTVLRVQIEERQKVEKALAEERNLLRTVIDNLPDLVYVKDMDHRYILGNKALVNYSGVTDESELIGKTVLDLLQSSNVRLQNQVAEQENEVLQGTPIINREYSWVDDDQTDRWFAVTKIPLRDHLGSITGLVGINREISERKQAEKTLAEERNLLRTVIDNLPDLVYVKDNNSRFVLGNKALVRFFEVVDEKDIIGKTSLYFRGEAEISDTAVVGAEEGRVFTGEEQAQYEFQYIDAKGSPRWFNVSKVPLRDHEGKITGLVGINREVSEQKSAEKTLAEERNLLRTVIDNLPDLVYVKDLASRFVLVNNAVVKRYGMSRAEQVLGKTDFDFHAPENAPHYREEELEIFQSGIPMVNREYPGIDDTGGKRWNLVTKVPLRDSQNNIIGLVGINHDITELKRAEEQLVQIFNSARCLMWYAIVDEKDDQFKWNFHVSNEEAAQRFLPVVMSPNQTYTDAWRESRFPEDREHIKQTSREALRSGRASYSQEYRCQQVDGQVRWLSEDVVVKTLTPGRWSLVGICTDITERKIAEEALQRANAELEQRVTERTAELSKANSALRASQVELQAKTESLTAINTISDTVYRSLDLQTVVERALDSIAAYAQVTAAGIMVLDEQAQVLRLLSSKGFSQAVLQAGSVLPLTGNLNGFALESKEIVTSEDIRGDERLKRDSQEALVSQGIRSAIVVPLVFQDHVMGTVNLTYKEQRVLTPQERETLSSIGKTIGIAMANAQYVAQIQAEVAERKRAEEAERSQRVLAEALRDTAAELSGTLDLTEVMDRVLTNVGRVLPRDAANILLVDDGQARVARHIGYDQPVLVALDVNQLTDLKDMVQQGRPRVIDDTRTYRHWSNRPEVAWIRSNVAAPIRSSGAVIGFLMLDSREPGTFTQTHAEQLQAFANQAGIAIDNARLYDAIQRHASELELRVRERTGELERERAQLSAILNAMSEGVTGVIENQRFANQALRSLTGYTAENFDARMFQSEEITDEDYQLFLQQVDSHVVERGVWKGDLKLSRMDGGLIDVAVTVSGVKGGDGEPIGTVMVIRDISQEKILAEQKARFIANASHELRTPLANIKTRLYLIQRQPEKIEEHLQIMELVANRMRSLIEDMLDVSRFERGLILLNTDDLVLQSIVNDVVSVQQPEAQLKQIQLIANMPDDPLNVNADPKRIIQVITNLVTNAINYTPEGGSIIVSAVLENDLDESYVVLRVQDSGIGISLEHLPHVFNPFFRANEHTSGTGLGLSIAKEIVELHHGHITVESEMGVGSSFNVYLPLIEPSN